MARRNNSRRGKISYSVVVDGETEKWYLDFFKQEENLKGVKVLPELPQKRKLKDQFEDVCEKAKYHDKVYWIIDLDVIHKQTREHNRGGETPIAEFNRYRQKLNSESRNIIVIVNNTCLEFWFLLHFKPITRRFNKCDAVIKELQKYIEGYEKTKKFYHNSRLNIYKRLKSEQSKAIKNAEQIGVYNPYENDNSISEMYIFFKDILNIK